MKNFITENWVSVLGKFDIKTNNIILHGEPITYTDSDNKEVSGLAPAKIISDQIFNEGEIETDIEFEDVYPNSYGEIIFYYNPLNGDTLSAGIAGSPFMFTIRRFTNQTWQHFADAGSHENLKAHKKYNIKVLLKGSRVSLKIDGVEVLSHLLPLQLNQSQPGLFSLNGADVKITSYKIKSEKPKAFVIMEFSEKYNELYEEAIKEVCEEFKLEVIRADEIHSPGIIMSDVIKSINEAKVVIADVSPVNANVFYEVGYSHARGRPTILLAEKETILPFDISQFRTIKYQNTIAGKRKIQESLRKQLDSILSLH